MWRRFLLALEPLRNKLGAVLFQFPPWFFYRRSNLEHIARCGQILDGYQLAVEFRNETWFNDKHRDEVLAFCQARPMDGGSGAVIVLLKPRFRSCAPPELRPKKLT